MNDVVFDLHAIRGCVAPGDTVEIFLADIKCVQSQLARNAVENVFDGDCTLRAAKSAKGRVRLCVGARGKSLDINVAQVVGIVDMTHRTRHDRAGQIGRISGTGHQFDLQRLQQSLMVKSSFVIEREIMALAGDHHVVVAVKAKLHGAAQPLCGDRGDTGKLRRLRFFAAESAAHSPCFHHDLVCAQFQRMRDQMLHFSRMLGRTPKSHSIFSVGAAYEICPSR